MPRVKSTNHWQLILSREHAASTNSAESRLHVNARFFAAHAVCNDGAHTGFDASANLAFSPSRLLQRRSAFAVPTKHTYEHLVCDCTCNIAMAPALLRIAEQNPCKSPAAASACLRRLLVLCVLVVFWPQIDAHMKPWHSSAISVDPPRLSGAAVQLL